VGRKLGQREGVASPATTQDRRSKTLGFLMAGPSQPRLTTSQLEARWREIDAAEPGSVFVGLSIREMPPWDEMCSKLNWEFHLPDDGSFSSKHHGFCGVYRLIALESEGDLTKPAALNRVCGSDTSGTLYIGEASHLGRRLNQLRRSGWGHRNEDSHGAISMMRQTPLLNYLPKKLAIALLFTVRDTGGVEGDLIRAYMNSFGDAPPLNYRL
jgi:hypothetical protein